MRVLQLGPYPPPHGGVEINLVSIRNYLRAHGHACGAINLTRYRRANADEVYYPESAAETLRLIAKLPYEILHLHIGGTVPFRLLMLSLICCWMPGRRAVLTFHSGGYATSPQGRAASPWTFAGFVFRRFDRIIAVNQQIVDLFRRYGVRKERIRLIEPHAISAQPEDVLLPPALAAFFRDHRPRLLTVSGLESEYDLPLQIELAGRLLQQHPKVGLAIIGSGSQKDNLRSLVSSKDYSEHVLLCGDVPHAATLRAIAECDVFLRTTLYDGDSISVREALHMGAPVIATDNGMRPAGVHLVPISNLDALASETCRVLSTETRKAVPSQPDETNLQAVEALYSELGR